MAKREKCRNAADIQNIKRAEVSGKKVNTRSSVISDKKVKAWAENFDIIVYQLAQSEDRRENSGDSNKMYMQIAGQCEKKQVYCVAFCQNGIQADSKFLQDVFYTSTANYGLTLLERIYNLLYFVREEDTDEV